MMACPPRRSRQVTAALITKIQRQAVTFPTRGRSVQFNIEKIPISYKESLL